MSKESDAEKWDGKRFCLYRDDAPDGKIFVGEDIPKALKDGWVDTPDDIKQPKGD